MHLHTRKSIIFLVIFQFVLVSGLLPAAKAGVVSTQTQIDSQSAETTKQKLQTMLSRDDVRQELIQLGVDPDMASERVASLTPQELVLLEDHLQDLPSGAGALEVIGILFLLLLILELLGVTNIFSRV